MEDKGVRLNRFLVEAFNELLKIEEQDLMGYAPDLSLREFHLLEDICKAKERGSDDRSTAIAAAQRVTAGTLTTVVSQLEKKGYVLRQRDGNDRRVVHLLPTEKGCRANECHTRFHRELVNDVLNTLSPEQAEVFTDALEQVAAFFRQKDRSQ